MKLTKKRLCKWPKDAIWLGLPSLTGPLCGWRYFLIWRETAMDMTCSHVLVVDDDLDMCNQLSDYLGRNDFRVTAVNTVLVHQGHSKRGDATV